MNDTNFIMRISSEQKKQLENKAKELNISVSALVKLIISNYLKEN